MPSLTDVALEGAFKYKDDVTITGSNPLHPSLSPIDIGALRHFSSSPAKKPSEQRTTLPINHSETPSPSSPPSDDCCLILSPLSFNKQLTSPTHHQTLHINSQQHHHSLHHPTTETPSPKAPHNGDWAHLPLTPHHHTHSPSGRDEDS